MIVRINGCEVSFYSSSDIEKLSASIALAMNTTESSVSKTTMIAVKPSVLGFRQRRLHGFPYSTQNWMKAAKYLS